MRAINVILVMASIILILEVSTFVYEYFRESPREVIVYQGGHIVSTQPVPPDPRVDRWERAMDRTVEDISKIEDKLLLSSF